MIVHTKTAVALPTEGSPQTLLNPYYSGLVSDHFDGVRFFNPGHHETDRRFRDILRWKFKESSAHWSSRTGRDRRMALWSGFILNTDGGSVYFAGDTGYGNGHIFRQMRQRIGRPDLALIPIGAYAPRWFMGAQHTDPAEAVQIMEDLEAAV